MTSFQESNLVNSLHNLS